MHASIISEVLYSTSAESSSYPEYAEIALSLHDDPAELVVYFYDTNGNLHSFVTGRSLHNSLIRLRSQRIGACHASHPLFGGVTEKGGFVLCLRRLGCFAL